MENAVLRRTRRLLDWYLSIGLTGLSDTENPSVLLLTSSS